MQVTLHRKPHRGSGILGAPSPSSARSLLEVVLPLRVQQGAIAPPIRKALAIGCAIITTSCSHAIPLQSQETPRGPIQYTLHTPATPAKHHVILAHGFLRSPHTMHHLAAALAEHGIETACIQLKRSTPFNGNHAENARDIIALRQALGWESATYAGFSAGGLSALLAAADDPACENLLLFDPVDHKNLGKTAAPKIQIPTLAILGRPGPGNAHRNASPMLDRIASCRTLEIPAATHCDFEARPSALCHLFTASKPDQERTANLHKTLARESIRLVNQNGRHPETTLPAGTASPDVIRTALAGRDASVVFIDCGSGKTTAFPCGQTNEPLPPCSTFKIVNALIGLETGILTSPDQPFYQWDGVERSIPGWNQDLTLKQAFTTSCVPAFQDLARRIGAERMQNWLDRLGYGNRDISVGIDVFWLPAKDRKTLLISAREQAEFIRRLVRGELPVAEKSITMLRELMAQPSTFPGKLHAKTGSGSNEDGAFNLGWFVGFVEAADNNTLAFACFARGENVMSKDARNLIDAIFTQTTSIP